MTLLSNAIRPRLVHDADAVEAVEVQPAPHLLNVLWHGHSRQDAPRWLVKKLLSSTGVVLLAGQSGAGKTFLAQCLAGCLATAEPFFGHRIKERVGTLFLCGEGIGTFTDRMEALRRGQIEPLLQANAAHGEVPQFDPDHLPIAWASAEGLKNPRVMAQVIADAQAQGIALQERYGVRLGMIVVDTLAATMGLEDENNASECTAAMQALDRLSQETGALVVAVAHFGKAEGSGVRGSSALTASSDTILAAVVDKTDLGQVRSRKLVLHKSRYAETGWAAPFRLLPVTLGTDEDGDDVTSCVIEPVTVECAPAAGRSVPLLPACVTFREALSSALASHGVVRTPIDGGPALRTVDVEHVRAAFYEAWPAVGETEARRQNTRRQNFKRGSDQAVERYLAGREMVDGVTLLWAIELSS